MATASSGGIKVVIAALVVLLVAGCDGSQTRHGADAKSNSSGSTGGHRTSALRLVALGDSISTDEHCVGCTTFVDSYGQMLARRTGSPVRVENLSVPGSGVAGLVKQTTRDHRTRAALAQADIVTVTIGINDTPWNRADDPCHVAPQYPFIKWMHITANCTANATDEYSSSLARVLHTITTLHKGKRRLLLRLTTVYNAVVGDQVDPSWNSPKAVAPAIQANNAFAQAQCALAARYGGRCADMLHSMNGPGARGDAARYLASDHTHLNQRGHQLTAHVLDHLGVW